MRAPLALLPATALLLLGGAPRAAAIGSIYEVAEIRDLTEPPPAPQWSPLGPWTTQWLGKGKGAKRTYHPCVELTVRTGKRVRAADTAFAVHFYDANRKPLASSSEVLPGCRNQGDTKPFALPTFFEPDQPARIFIAIPAQLVGKEWRAVAVFGDGESVAAKAFPKGDTVLFPFPEKARLGRTSTRKAEPGVLIERVVNTRSAINPRLTLFLRPPLSGRPARGVAALCLIGNSPAEVRRQIESPKPGEAAGGIFWLAEKYDLAVLAWGARTGMWDFTKNWNEMEPRAARELEREMGIAADAWEEGMLELCRGQGIRAEDMIAFGHCAGAQWVHRLVMRKPRYFLATYVDLSSSFARPEPEARRVLWCVSIGEAHAGYSRSLAFYQAARQAGFPILFKGNPGIGHAWTPLAYYIQMAFFDFALRLRREGGEAFTAARNAAASGRGGTPWVQALAHPEFVGDVVNQEMVAWSERDAIPRPFMTPLPNKMLAEIWAGRHEIWETRVAELNALGAAAPHAGKPEARGGGAR